MGYFQLREGFVGSFDFLEAVAAGMDVSFDEILQTDLVEDYSLVDGVAGDFQTEEFVSSAEIVVA